MKPVYKEARMNYNAEMIIVFWRQGVINSDGVVIGAEAKFSEFGQNELTKALAHCEALRTPAEGTFISHVCIQSELPDSVGKAGVSDKLPEDYSWYKRRIDPKIELGRERT
jgi:hypothetical protein